MSGRQAPYALPSETKKARLRQDLAAVYNGVRLLLIWVTTCQLGQSEAP